MTSVLLVHSAFSGQIKDARYPWGGIGEIQMRLGCGRALRKDLA